MRGKLFFIIVLIIFLPTVSSAEFLKVETGYELYMDLKKGDIEQPSYKYSLDYSYAYGLFVGFIQGGSHMNLLIQASLLNEKFTCKDPVTLKRVVSFNYKAPNRTSYGQLKMMFMKWAENNPKKLSDEWYFCIYSALSEELRKDK